MEEQEIHKLTDAKLQLEDGQDIPVHRVILAKNSTLYRKWFWHEDKDVYEVGAVSSEVMFIMLTWFHTRVLSLTEENVQSVLEYAHYIDCSEVISNCCTFLLEKMDQENCVGIWQFSRMCNLPELEEPVGSFMKKNLPSITREEEFLKMPEEFLIELLRWDWQNKREVHAISFH